MASTVLDLAPPALPAAPRTRRPRRPGPASAVPAVDVGVVTGRAPDGSPLVAFPADAPGAPVAARSLVAIAAADVGAEVALAFAGGDVSRPIVLGVLSPAPDTSRRVAVDADGDRLVLTAERELVLRCGNASITLTRAGKVLIAGEYVLTRARGVNRIRGGSVQIN